jgi:arginine exporter protein ArgO
VGIDLVDVVIQFVSSNLDVIVPLAGSVGILVAATLIVSISRPDKGPATSYVRAARQMARLLLGAAIVLPVVLFLAGVARPAGFEPMFNVSRWYAELLPWVGAAAYVVGLGWMIRIYRRSHLEPDASYWRYRD